MKTQKMQPKPLKAVDALGRELLVGDTVAYASIWGNAARLRFKIISKVENGKVWLEGKSSPLVNPDRYVIVKYAGE